MVTDQREFDDSVLFAENPEERCPVVLLLDTSHSMSGERISALIEGIQTFEQCLKDDSLAAKRVEAAFVSFGPVTLEKDFGAVENLQSMKLTSFNRTPIVDRIQIQFL